jgi:hypothetical protein
VKHFYSNREWCEVLTAYLSLWRWPGGDWANTWLWTQHFKSSFQTETAAAHSYVHVFFLIAFLEEVFIGNISWFFFFFFFYLTWVMSSFLRFLVHTQRLNTVGRTLLDEWLARRRDFYLTTHNTHNRQTSIPPVEFKPTISAGGRSQTYALDRAATGTGIMH